MNRTLGKKGLCFLLLQHRDGRALIYVYRPARLVSDLKNESASVLLKERGYPTAAPARCIAELIRRLEGSDEFPHEIGLFLGYPPEDVSGFIENKALGCKCIGCWKVYGDLDEAKRSFARFKKCTEVYCAQWSKGKSIERLTVAV